MSSSWLVVRTQHVFNYFIDNLVYYRYVEDILEYYARPGRHPLPRSMISLLAIVAIVFSRAVTLTIVFFMSYNAQIAVFNLSTIAGGDPNHQIVKFSLDFLTVALYLRLFPLLYHDRHYSALLIVKKVIERANTPVDFDRNCLPSIFSYFAVQYILWDEHLRDDDKRTWTFAGKIIFIEVNSIYAYLDWYFVVIIFADGFLLMSVFSIFVFDRLRCYEQRYLASKDVRFTARSFDNFVTRHNRIFQSMISVNEIFSDTFLLSLLVIYPVNSYLFIGLIVDRFHFLNVVFRSLYVSQSYYYIFFMHLMAVMHSLRIHHFTKSMFHNSFHFHAPLSARLRLSHYLERFHTRKKYGFTYSKFGTISFIAFTKFLFIYIRFLLFFYRNSQIRN